VPAWSISATIHPERDGRLLLEISVPGSGSLSAEATPVLPVSSGSHPAKAGKTKAKGSRTPGPTKLRAAGATARKEAHTTSARIAQAAMKTKLPGVVLLRLSPAARYLSLIRSRYGLYATIELTFTAPGHPPLEQQLEASFLVQAPAKRTAARRSTQHSDHAARPRSKAR
jgi:hypothetical protein